MSQCNTIYALLGKISNKPVKTKMTGFLITSKYAYDITYARTSKQQISELGKKASKLLKKFELSVNTNKTERVFIRNPPPPPKYQIRKL